MAAILEPKEDGRLELRDAEREALDRVFGASPDLVFIYDRHGRYLYVNPPAARALHQRDIVGKTPKDLGLPAKVMEPFEANFREVVATGKALTDDVSLAMEGGFRRYEYSLGPIRARDGFIEGVAAVARDVTERRSAEEDRNRLVAQLADERRRAEELAADAQQRAGVLDAVFTAMGEAVNLYGPDGSLLRANPASAEAFGFDPSGVKRDDLVERLALRRPDGEPVPPEELPSSRALRGEAVHRERLLFRDARGRDRVALVSVSPLRADGTAAGAVGVWDDVTDLEQAISEVERQRGRLEAVVEQMPAGVLIAEAPSGRVLLMNDQARQILEHPREMALSASELLRYPQQAFHPDGRVVTPDEYPLVRAVAHGEVVPFEELTVARSDGSRVVLNVGAGPIRGHDGQIVAAVSTFIDITERRRAEQERDAARQRALESEREKKLFLREVVRAITHGKFCLAERDEIPSEGRLVLTMALDGPESYALLRQRLMEEAVGAGVSESDAHDLVLVAGEGAINAIKHGVDPRVAVFVAPDRVAVRVCDRGTGIRSENIPASLLEPGFSTKVSLGMGYTIMLRLADRIWLATGPEGTILQLEKWTHPEAHRESDLPVAWNRL